jgi:DNA-binding XRE family transcriptional regulator
MLKIRPPMPVWRVEDYKDANGHSRVREFLNALQDARPRKQAAALIKALQTRGSQMRSPASAALGGGLFELRGDEVRIFYCFRPGGRIFLIDGIIKNVTKFRPTFWQRYARSKRRFQMKREKPFMDWLDDKVRDWDLETEVEEEFNRLMLHQRIADLRERAGLSQAELAKRSGVSQPMIAKLESGRADNLTLRTFIRYALALGYAPQIDFVPVPPVKSGRMPRRRGDRITRRASA